MSGKAIVVALAFLAIVPYTPALDDPLFADDYIHLARLDEHSGDRAAALLRGWILRSSDTGAWWTQTDLRIAYFRPLTSLSFLIDRSLWRDAPFGYHATNILFHAATTLVVFGIARVLGFTPTAGLVSAALFAVHPAHAEAVVWTSARTDVLCGLFYGLAFLLYVRGRSGSSRRSAWLAGSVLSAAAALLAKEMAVTLPAVLLAYEIVYRRRGSGRPTLATLGGPAAAAALVVTYLALRSAIVGEPTLPPHPLAHGLQDPDMAAHLLTSAPQYLLDLVLFVPPDPLVTGPFWHAHPTFLVFATIVCVALFAGTLRAPRDRTVVGFAVAWMALTLLPVLPLTAGERFLYVPSIGYCLLVGARPWKGDAGRQSAARGVVVVAALVFVVLVAKILVLGAVASRARGVIDEARAAIDERPDASLVVIADAPAVSVLGLPQAIRLARPSRRVDVEIVSIAPHFIAADGTFASTIKEIDDGALRVRADAQPYLGTYIERAFLGGARLAPGGRVTRPSMDVLIRDAAGDRLREFEVRPRPQGSAVLMLVGDGFRLHQLAARSTGPAERR